MFEDRSMDERIISRAWQDAEFLQQLTVDPHGAIRVYGEQVLPQLRGARVA